MKRTWRPLIGTALALLLIFGVLYYLRHRRESPAPPAGGGPPAVGTGGLPVMPSKPQPVNITFKGCPPEGDGGDPLLNRLKNRVDEGNYLPVEFDAIARLAWPKAVEQKFRARWSAGDRAAVEQYEGLPVAVEGYLARSKKEGPESPNCHGADDEFRDFHIWLTKSPGDDRSQAIVVETTPPVRDKHPGWTTAALGQVARNNQRVRISGWLMLDPEHPDQVGKTRATIWEIHPIMKIEVEQSGRWVIL
ncbi:MAG TPA: hypothetical protein VFD58_16305 [Blastocatellia bacterium]|nr:hypothetical protein [Blastocatellia bacterium]